MTKYQLVVLRVPFGEHDDTPDNWNWTTLCDATEVVACVAWGPVEDPGLGAALEAFSNPREDDTE